MDVLPDPRVSAVRPATLAALLVMAVLQSPLGLLLLVTEWELGGFAVDLPWWGLTLVAAMQVRAGERGRATAVAWWVLGMALLTIPLWFLGLLHLLQSIAVVWLVRRP